MTKTSKTMALLLAVSGVLAACNAPADKTAPAANAPVETASVAAAQAPEAAPTSAAGEAAAMAANPAPGVFPVGFRGNWDWSDKGCAKDESGTRFQITAKEIKGYEDTSKLVAIEQINDLAIHVVLDVSSSDGDETITQNMSLSPVAGVTLRVERNGKTVMAYRCDPV